MSGGLSIRRQTALFLRNTTQAVHLSRDGAFLMPSNGSPCIRDGGRRIITPAGLIWEDVFDAAGVDFALREQPLDQRRETF